MFFCWTHRVISKQVVVSAPGSREKLLVRFTRLGILGTPFFNLNYPTWGSFTIFSCACMCFFMHMCTYRCTRVNEYVGGRSQHPLFLPIPLRFLSGFSFAEELAGYIRLASWRALRLLLSLSLGAVITACTPYVGEGIPAQVLVRVQRSTLLTEPSCQPLVRKPQSCLCRAPGCSVGSLSTLMSHHSRLLLPTTGLQKTQVCQQH